MYRNCVCVCVCVTKLIGRGFASCRGPLKTKVHLLKVVSLFIVYGIVYR